MRTDAPGWTLSNVWGALRKYWALVVALTIIGGAAGFVSSAMTTPQYDAKASLYFSLNQGTSASDLNQGATYTQSQMLSFAQLATSSRVLEQVIFDLELSIAPRELRRAITITIPQDTVILEVQARSHDPEIAALLANGVATALTEVVQDVAPQAPDATASITASIVDEAVPPTVQSVPNKSRDALLAAVLGFVLGVLAALVAALSDTRVRNEAAVARVTELPVLGTVARMPKNSGLVAVTDPNSHAAEDFRRVQAALVFSNVDGAAKRLLVTSATPGEGKSLIITNLAATFAELGDNVVLIDGDLRRPRVADYFGIDGAVGLTSIVRGAVEPEAATLRWGATGPDIIASGAIPPNPAPILTSGSFEKLVADQSESHDVLLIDSPPVLSVADASLIAPIVDGAVIVVDASRTKLAQLSNALRALEGTGVNIVGIVLNKVRPARSRSEYYGDTTQFEQSRRPRRSRV